MSENENLINSNEDFNQELYDSLVDPNAPKQIKFSWDIDLQQNILACIHVKDWLDEVIDILEPKFFIKEEHETLASILICNYRLYGHIPSQELINAEIDDKIIKDKNKDSQVKKAFECKMEYDAIRQQVKVINEDKEHYKEKVRQFAKRQLNHSFLLTLTDKLSTGKPVIQDIFTDHTKKLEQIDAGFSQIEGLSTADMFALDVKWDYLIEDFLLRGSFNLMPGEAKDGKTTFNLNQIRDILTTGMAFNRPAVKCPIYYLDYEMGKNIFIPNWLRTIGENKPSIQEYFKYFSKDAGKSKLPPYISVNWLKKLTNEKESGIIYIDSFRRAFTSNPITKKKAGWEWDTGIITELLTPFVDWCHESNWSIIMPHHLNKMGQVGGSNDFRAVVDAIWTFERVRLLGKKTNNATLTIEHRALPVDEQNFTFKDGCYKFLGNKVEKKVDAKETIKKLILEMLENGKVKGQKLMDDINEQGYSRANITCVKRNLTEDDIIKYDPVEKVYVKV